LRLQLSSEGDCLTESVCLLAALPRLFYHKQTYGGFGLKNGKPSRPTCQLYQAKSGAFSSLPCEETFRQQLIVSKRRNIIIRFVYGIYAESFSLSYF